MLGADLNEVDVETVDRSDELRQGIQPRLNLSPVVVVRPILGELLHGRELDALRCIADKFAARPSCGGDAPAEVDEVCCGEVDAEGRIAAPRPLQLAAGKICQGRKMPRSRKIPAKGS